MQSMSSAELPPFICKLRGLQVVEVLNLTHLDSLVEMAGSAVVILFLYSKVRLHQTVRLHSICYAGARSC